MHCKISRLFVCGLLLATIALFQAPQPARAQLPSADASDLVYSTFLGGESADMVNDLALDSDGNAYVGGLTCTDEFLTIFDPIHPEIIGCDPFVAKFDTNGALVFATALGGTETNGGDGFAEYVSSIVLDTERNIYVTGSTNAPDFPTTPNAFDSDSTEYRGKAFVAKFDSQGRVVYSTYLGGHEEINAYDVGKDIVTNASGQAFVTGYTRSADFPTTENAYDKTFAAGNGGDAFLAQLNDDGSDLIYSTFLGRRASDTGSGIALDGNGDVIIAGQTESRQFPTTPGAFQREFHECANGYCPEGFVAKFSATTGDLVFSTLFGGNGREAPSALAIDDLGAVYVTGQTDSLNFPVTKGAYDTTLNDKGPYGGDAFVLKLKADGSALEYATLLGGRNYEAGLGIAVDDKGAAHVVGYTTSKNFPTTRGAFDRRCNKPCAYLLDAFFVKLNPRGTNLRYGTFLGGTGYDRVHVARGDPDHDAASGIVLDAQGIAHIVGSTKSTQFPTTPDAYDKTLGSFQDGFFLKIKPKFRK